jgi:hypothetical protein
MKSQIDLIVALVALLFVAIVLCSLLQRQIEKRFLTDEERIKVKGLVPWYVWLPAILFVPGFSMVFLEVFGFADSFSDTVTFLLYLFIFLFLFGYRYVRISKINLPAEFVGKWRKLDVAFALVGILFMTAILIRSFVRWQTEGYRIFPSE